MSFAPPRSGRTEPGRLTSQQGFVAAITALGTVLLLTACTQLPASGVPSWLHRYEATYRAIWPQGWGFFASAGNNAVVTVFPVAGDGRTSGPIESRFATGGDRWGLNRTSQAAFTEATYLASRVPAKSWTTCRASALGSCLDGMTPTHLVNVYQPALICGLNLFVAQPPDVGFGAAQAGSEPAALVAVSCPH